MPRIVRSPQLKTRCMTLLREPLGFALCGASGVAPAHGHALKSSPHTRLVSVYSRDTGRAQRLATALGCDWTNNYDDLLNDPRVAALDIATEPARHAALALPALACGKHVLIEKPIDVDLDAAARIVAADRLRAGGACASGGRFTQVSKVLLIGGSGQLGMALGAAFERGHHVVSTAQSHLQPGQIALDLGDATATTALLQSQRPEVVLVAGAMCHVDLCEQEPDLCRRINVEGPAAIAEYARRTGARVVFFSTDHVFDGARHSYAENDEVHPLSTYASSKMEAENAIRGIVPAQHLIIRTGWVYGHDNQRRNFILRLIDRLRQGETVDVPADQWGCPTYTDDLVQAVRFLVDEGAIGTFHATGPDLIDRASLARRVCDRFDLDADRVMPRPTRALGQAARRSLRVLLDCGKLSQTGAPGFRGLNAGLDALTAWSASVRECEEAR